jgi:hypothetical protein
MTRYGQNFRFNLRNLDTIITLLQADNINIHTSQCMFERGGKNLLFLCIDAPRFLSPRNQANSRQRMIFRNNQLEGAYLRLLNRQINQHHLNMIDDVPMLEEEDEEQEQEEQVQEEQEMILEEEVVVPIIAPEEREVVEAGEDEQKQRHPYQLTLFYQNSFLRFEEGFQQWVNEQYEREKMLFEQQQQQHYDVALVIEQQLYYNNVPLVDEEDHDEEIIIKNNPNAEDDNIIIDPNVDDDVVIIGPNIDDDVIIIVPNDGDDVIIDRDGVDDIIIDHNDVVDENIIIDLIGHDNVPDEGLEQAEEEIEVPLARQEVQQHQHIPVNPVDCHIEIPAEEAEAEEEEEDADVEGNYGEQQL